MEVDHGDLDQVGRGPLDDRVDRDAFCERPALWVASVDFSDGSPPTQHGLDIPMRLSELDAFLEERGDVRKLRFVVVDDRCGFGVGYIESSRQSPGGDAVDDPEVDHLRARALVLGNLVERDVVDLRRDRLVDVLARFERGDERGVLRQMRQDPQLDLRIVSGDQLMMLWSDKRLADLATDLRADRDVLEVRVRRAEPSCGCDGLMEARVDAVGCWVDVVGERLEIGRDQLGELSVLEDERRDRCENIGIKDKFVEDLSICRVPGLGFLDGFDPHPLGLIVFLVEEGRGELLGTVEIKGAPDGVHRFGVDLFDELVDPCLETGFLLAQLLAINDHAVLLKGREHIDQRHLELLVQLGQRGFLSELLGQHLVELERHIRVLRGVRPGLR